MKRRTLLTFIALFSGSMLYAQVHFTAGPVGGATFADRLYFYKTGYQKPSTTSMGTALSYGLVMNLRFTPRFSLQTQVNYQGYKSSYVEKDLGGNQMTDEYNLTYINIPLNMVLDLGTNQLSHLMFFVGPYFETALSGKFTRDWDYDEGQNLDLDVEFTNVPEDYHLTYLNSDVAIPSIPTDKELANAEKTYLNSYNIGANAGLGLKIGPVYLYGGYYYGFINMKALFDDTPEGYSRGDMAEYHHGIFTKLMVLIPDWEGPTARSKY